MKQKQNENKQTNKQIKKYNKGKGKNSILSCDF